MTASIGEIDHVTDTAFWFASIARWSASVQTRLFVITARGGPLGAMWHEKADRVLGYTLFERRGQ